MPRSPVGESSWFILLSADVVLACDALTSPVPADQNRTADSFKDGA